MLDCPDVETLGRLMLGQLNAQEALSLDSHLEHCTRCLEVLRELNPSDPLIDIVRRQAAVPGHDGDSLVDALVDRLNLALADTVHPHATPCNDELAPNSADTSSPRLFGDYELLEQVGRGGMGVVYRARQRSLDRIVAIKMILAGDFADTAEIRRFHAEAEAAARLDHAGIVPVYEIGQCERQHYFTMGFVAGDSLAMRLATGPLPPRDSAEIARQVAEAVHYAHERGVVHRDLKPGNILLQASSSPDSRLTSGGIQLATHAPWKPRVTDFGLAKRLDTDQGLTQSGDVMGTPSFMPPEQAAGKADRVGPLADVYAMGAVLYAMLAGRPPFQAANVAETLRQVSEQEPVALRLLNPAVPRDLETITHKCLEKNPLRRYDDARQLAEELARFLAGEPILARPLGRVARMWRWCRRKPALAAAAAVSFLATIAVIATLSVSVLLIAQARDKQQRSAETAEAQARLALESLERVVFQIQNRLNSVPGSQAVRKEILRQSLDGLRQVAKELAGSNRSDRGALAAHVSLGDVFLTIGDDDGLNATGAAREQYSRALAIAERLAKSTSHSLQAQQDLSQILVKLSDNDLQAGDLEAAHRRANAAFEALQRLSLVDQKSPRSELGLASCYMQLGETSRRLGQSDIALQWLQRAIELQRLRETARPDDPSIQMGLASAYDRLGGLCLQVGQTDEGLVWKRSSVTVWTRLHEKSPDSDWNQQQLARACGSLADEMLRTGHADEAHPLAAQAMELRERLARKHPGNLAAEDALADSLVLLGDIAQRRFEHRDALDHFVRAREMRERTLKADSENFHRRRSLCGLYRRLGVQFSLFGRQDEALQAVQRRLELHKDMAAANPTDISDQHDLANAYFGVGGVLAQQGQWRAAIKLCEQSVEVLEKLREIDAKRTSLHRDLSNALAYIGYCLRSQDNPAAALPYYERSLAIQEELASQDQGNRMNRQGLALTHQLLGDLYDKLKRGEQAWRHYQQARSLYEQQLADDPTNAAGRTALGLVISHLASLAQGNGQLEAALTLYQESLAVRQKIVADSPGEAVSQVNLASGYESLGSISFSLRRFDGVRDAYLSAIDLREEILQHDPRDLASARALSGDFKQLSRLESLLRNPTQARLRFEQALRIDRRLAETMPVNLSDLSVLGNSYREFADQISNAGDVALATLHDEKAIMALERVAEAAPGEWVHVQQLALAYLSLAQRRQYQGCRSEAYGFCNRGLELWQRIAVAPTGQQLLGRAALLSGAGRLLGGLNLPNESVVAFQLALQDYQAALESQPDSLDNAFMFHVACKDLGLAQHRAGQIQPAVESFRRGLTAIEPLTQHASLGILHLGMKATLLGATADALRDAGLKADSVAALQQAADVRQRLVNLQPLNDDAKRDLAAAYKTLGMNVVAPVDSLRFHQRNREIHQALLKANPQNTQARYDLASADGAIANPLIRLGRLTEAAESAERAAAGLKLLDNDKLLPPNDKILQSLYESIAGFYREAETVISNPQSVESIPPSRRCMIVQMACRGLLAAQRWEDAKSLIKAVERPGNANERIALAACHAMLADSMAQRAGHDDDPNLAQSAAGHRDRALAELRLALTPGDTMLRFRAKDEDFKVLQGLTEYQQLVAEPPLPVDPPAD